MIKEQTSNTYDLSDFNKIKQDGFEYTIPDTSRELITLLANLVGSPNYSKSPYFIKTDKKKKRVTETYDMGWDMLRNFKKTEVKEKTEIEKELDTIRILMNKLTRDNYNTIIQQIKTSIEKIKETPSFDQVISLLFKIALSNRFYSEVYAKLYTDLKDEYPSLKEYFTNTLDSYMELFKNIESCNPDKDYDKFCNINKQNEHRRSITTFLVNCMKFDVIDVKIITNMLFYLQTLLLDSITDIMKMEEITENFFIIIKNGLNRIVLSDEWGNIYEYIQHNAVNKSFNTKIRFRFMDLLDLTN
jgi:hypothetical protein